MLALVQVRHLVSYGLGQGSHTSPPSVVGHWLLGIVRAPLDGIYLFDFHFYGICVPKGWASLQGYLHVLRSAVG